MATSLHAGAGSGSDTGSDRVPPLDRSRHLKYWKRCLRTVLPTQYTSMDSTRMTLGFFILSAIDLLSAPSESSPSAADTQQSQQPQSQASEPESLLTATDRRQLRDWVLACQHPSGGFAGSPTHAVPHNTAKLAGGVKEGAGTANLAATAFALLLLPLLAEDDGDGSGASSRAAYSGVRRRETLAWLRRLQREDGSFGEMLAEDLGGGSGVRIAGSRDMRFAYFAAMVRWMLRCGEGEDEEDINVDALVKFISRAQTYDGGFAETGDNEPHGRLD